MCTKTWARTLPGAPPQREQRLPRVWSAPEAFTRGISLSAGASLPILVKLFKSKFDTDFLVKWSEIGSFLVNPCQMFKKSTFDKDVLVKRRFFEHLTRIDKEVRRKMSGMGASAGFPCQCLSVGTETDFQVERHFVPFDKGCPGQRVQNLSLIHI